jgi:aldehyde dehydrogenase (NAD+)
LLEGGRAEVKGHEHGYYVKPALLTGDSGNLCAREEIFGPAAYLMTFSDEDKVVELVNSSSYGLANSVWSANVARANRVAERLVAGNSWINAHNLFAHGIPYGGCNLSGCGGGVLGPETLSDYLRNQSVVRPRA